MDIVSLKDLPLPIAVIAICFYFLNQNNAEFNKKLVALIGEFTGKYEAVLKTLLDERKTWNENLLEQNRQLMTIAREATEAQVRNTNETHALRNLVQPLVIAVQEQRKRGGAAGGRPGGGNPNATG